jgi:hypothetical protein
MRLWLFVETAVQRLMREELTNMYLQIARVTIFFTAIIVLYLTCIYLSFLYREYATTGFLKVLGFVLFPILTFPFTFIIPVIALTIDHGTQRFGELSIVKRIGRKHLQAAADGKAAASMDSSFSGTDTVDEDWTKNTSTIHDVAKLATKTFIELYKRQLFLQVTDWNTFAFIQVVALVEQYAQFIVPCTLTYNIHIRPFVVTIKRRLLGMSGSKKPSPGDKGGNVAPRKRKAAQSNDVVPSPPPLPPPPLPPAPQPSLPRPLFPLGAASRDDDAEARRHDLYVDSDESDVDEEGENIKELWLVVEDVVGKEDVELREEVLVQSVLFERRRALAGDMFCR